MPCVLCSANVIISRVAQRVLVQTCRQSHVWVCRSVGLSVRRLYCGKTADWIWMSFRVVIAVGRRMGVLVGVEIVERKGTFGGKCGAFHCNQWEPCGLVILCSTPWRCGS